MSVSMVIRMWCRRALDPRAPSVAQRVEVGGLGALRLGTPGAAANADVVTLRGRPQRADGALLPRDVGKRIVLKDAHGVAVRDAVDVLVGHPVEVLHGELGRVRPR